MEKIILKTKKKNILKRLFGFTVFSFLVLVSFLNFEPSIVEAETDDITVTQYVTGDITISPATNVSLVGTIYGMTGGTGTGSAMWTVTTGNLAGFNMSIKTDVANCLKKNGTDHFDDYSPTVSYDWTAPAISAFGFTVEPETVGDTVLAFRNDVSSTCGVGALNGSDTCWRGLNSTTAIPMISRGTATDGNGQDEVVKFKSQLVSGQFLPEGDYVANVTVTAIVN